MENVRKYNPKAFIAVILSTISNSLMTFVVFVFMSSLPSAMKNLNSMCPKPLSYSVIQSLTSAFSRHI